MNCIVLDGVHKTFRKTGFFGWGNATETHALRDVSLNIARGEVFGLLGPNGSGKSTTLKLLSTVLRPDQGRISVNSADTRSDEQKVRRQVGFALASERSFFPRLNARENLEFFAVLENVRECRNRVERVLNEVGLQGAAEKQVMKFSSGMHQRLAIARALIKNPSVLLLDEPTRSLDPAGASHIWSLVRSLADTGITLVLATHNFVEVSAVCDRFAVLQMGKLLATSRVNQCTAGDLRASYFEITGAIDSHAWAEGVPA
jgi:ABC-2 type transport system ATP-binding protein